jgi:hypothetical protein
MTRWVRTLLQFPMLLGAAGLAPHARADHTCDPVTEPGWSVVATHETIRQVDGPPLQDGASGNWYVERSTTVLPFCNYFNEIGIYSMRSYSLTPEEKRERVAICRATPGGGNAAVPPYAGGCPPKP